MIFIKYRCSRCKFARQEKERVRRHVRGNACQGAVVEERCYNVPTDDEEEIDDEATPQVSRIDVPYDEMVPLQKIGFIANIQNCLPRFTHEYTSSETRKNIIICSIKDEEGWAPFENDSTVEDVFITMARLNFGDLAQDENKYVWIIEGTELCVFVDRFMVKVLKLDDIKDYIKDALKKVIRSMLKKPHNPDNDFPGKAKIQEILETRGGVSWWNRMKHDEVWEKIKPYIPTLKV
jgi:hypothetical protein